MFIVIADGEGRQAPPFQSLASGCIVGAMTSESPSFIPDDQICATIEMHTRFHRAATHGTLTAAAKVLTAGSRVIQLECKTTDADGRLVASSTGSFAVLLPRPS